MSDPVNPAHYQGDYVMRVIEGFQLDFCKGQVVKYVLRAGRKDANSEIQDLQKAAWYLDRKLKQLTGTVNSISPDSEKETGGAK